MSRKLLLSSIAIAATATMLGVGTYATFSDQETSATATVTAGTLNLEVGGNRRCQQLPSHQRVPGLRQAG